MFAILKKELKAYFYAPVAYVLIAFFLIIASVIFFIFCIGTETASMAMVMVSLEIVLLVILPIMTMKLFAEEKKNNTEVLLLTSPVHITKIVLGKYLATFLLFLIMTGLTLIYTVILFIYGDPSLPGVAGAYVAFLLYGALIIAINVFVSSLTENQVIAAIACFGVNIVVFLLDNIKYMFGNTVGSFLAAASPLARTEKAFTGLIPVNMLVYFVIGIAIFLFFTVRTIEKKRWS